MKICMLSNALSIHTQRWASAFADRGHQVHLLSIRKADIAGVTVHTINIGPVNSTSKVFTLLSYLYLFFTARSRIKKINPDIVNAHYASTHGVIAAFANIHPLVISVWGADIIYDNGPQTPLIKKTLLRFSLNTADIITGTSKFLVEKIAAYVNSHSKIQQVAFGVDISKFTPSSQKKYHNIRIGFVKSLKPKYGPKILLKAFKMINHKYPDTELVMAGNGPMKQELKKIADALNLSDKVEFTGFVSSENLPRHFMTLDIFVQPSIYQSESFGVAVLEASACGVPVVATDVGGVQEVCINQKTGFLVPPNDPDAIADAVIKLLDNPSLMQEYGKNGREFVINNYKWPDCVNKMITIFENLKSI